MKKFIQITMATGHVFEIPTSVVASNRATAMLALHPGEFADLAAAEADTAELFEDDSFPIQDWAQNNMHWHELSNHAKLVRVPSNRDDNGWPNVEFSFHDHPALMGDLDGDQIMSQPVELVMHTMATSGQLCNVTVLNGSDGQPYGAFALMFGNRAVIDSYIMGLQFVGEQLTKGAQAEQADTPAH